MVEAGATRFRKYLQRCWPAKVGLQAVEATGSQPLLMDPAPSKP